MTPEEMMRCPETPSACPKCKTSMYIRQEPTDFGWFVCCGNCYDVDCVGDPAEYRSLSPFAHGRTLREAFEAWNDTVELVDE